jgi:fibro-slime domain-containing protein
LASSLGWGALFACSSGGGKTDNGSGDSDSSTGGSGSDVTGDLAVDDIGTLDGGGGETSVDPTTLPPTPNCGDGVRDDDEACDDGNLKNGDGCYGNCRVIEPGFICPTPGELCRPFARCGDGIVAFPEQCDGGADGVIGCSDRCKVEIGYICNVVDGVTSCTTTTCGDGIVEGAETCDDGDLVATPPRTVTPFDGCDTRCQAEPNCVSGGCTSTCGDGIVLNEACDDGNKTDGDGCSSTCTVEDGYTCTQAPCQTEGDVCILEIPAVFRDFWFAHPDFEVGCGNLVTGVVQNNLDSQAKPQVSSSFDLSQVCIQSADTFKTWYRDTPGTDKSVNNTTYVGQIKLFETSAGSGSYVNRYKDDGTRYNGLDGNPLFFPIDSECSDSDNECSSAKIPQEVYGGNWNDEPGTPPHNFSFTSEVTFWFQYDSSKSATLSFVGDDDVWVFINRRLAVDLGGLHVPTAGSVTVDSTATSKFGNLVNGKVYEIKVFHAERKRTGSSFKLTLAGFNSGRSDCTATCGDGIIGGEEECDDGVNDGGYNECQPGCVLGGYCGDGIKQSNEACDDRAPGASADCHGCHIVTVK